MSRMGPCLGVRGWPIQPPPPSRLGWGQPLSPPCKRGDQPSQRKTQQSTSANLPPAFPKLILQQRNKGAFPCLFPFILQLAGL